MTLWLVLALPLAAVGISWLPLGRRLAPAATLAASSLTLAATLSVLAAVLTEGRVVALSGWVAVDALGALVLTLVAWVGWLASLYSWGYLEAEARSDRRVRFYYTHLNLFLFALLAAPLMDEPALAWAAIEFTALFSVLLVAYENSPEALEAAWKYIAIMFMGAAIALLGFLMLFWAQKLAGGGVFSWSGLVATRGLSPRLVGAAFVLVLVGLGTKVGFVPMHTWLPDAHSQAPTPVCALLSGVKTTVALYCILRLLPLLPETRVGAWAEGVGLLSAGVAAFLLLQVRDYKRMFAFSTVEHMGLVFAAIGLGGAAARSAALFQMVAHSVTKSFCFFAAGAMLLAFGTREIAAVRQALRRAPGAAVALLFGGLAIAGMPPMAIFSSELAILRSGLAGGHYLVTALLALFIVVAFFGILRHVDAIGYGLPDRELEASLRPVRRVPLTCRVTLILAAVPPLVLGLWQPEGLHALIVAAAREIAR